MPSSNSNSSAAQHTPLPQRKTINSQQAVVSSSRVPWHYCASNPRMITQSRDASSALATRTATAAEPTRTSQKSSELRSVSKARRPAGSAPQCCKPQIGYSVMCRSVRAGVRACGREHLQRQQQQQASPKQRKRVFLASPPLPRSQFRVRERAKDETSQVQMGEGSAPVASASRSVLCSWADARCAGMWWS